MKAKLSFDSDKPDQLEEAVGLSLESTDKVSYIYNSDDGHFNVEINTDKVGSLRGATDAVFRLVSLSKRLR